jgi:zinc transport system substrate-binding protein
MPLKPGENMIRNVLVLLTLLLVSSNGFSEPLRVFASVLPIKTFVEKIGAEHVDVREMVRPGFNPHTYDPTPQQISALSSTVLYVRTGVPFEQAWMKRIRAANPDMQILDVRDGISLQTIEAHSHKEHKVHKAHADEQDPHLWTNPLLVKHMVGKIRDKLSELDPVHAKEYARNHDVFLAELETLDHELHQLLEPLPNRKFMVFHPAWGYFADQYQLIQVPIEYQGKEPGARRIASLIKAAKHENIKVIFVQPQFDKAQARQVAREIGGSVIAVDPLAVNYVDNLRRVGQAFAQVLK